MKKTQQPKLKLNKSTVRTLQNTELGNAGGAGAYSYRVNCSNSCYSCNCTVYNTIDCDF